MRKLLLILPFFLIGSFVFGQIDSLTREERQALDSMFKNDEFIKLMFKNNKSFFDINLGVGNAVFSQKNNSLNAGQAETQKIFYTPSIGYNHKNGFAISVSGFLSSDAGSLKFYQYAINPSYTYYGKKINAGISYTRFIEGSSTSFDVSPFKNDFYGSILFKKPWIEPGLALGYSFGKLVEYFDSSFWYTPPPPGIPRVIHITDTITTRLHGFSLILSATHKWNFFGMISKADAIRLQPTLLLNGGSQRWNTSHSSSLNSRRAIVQNLLKRRYGDGSSSESFKMQSLAFLAEITYYYGKFYMQPQVYFDYYLPATTEKRLTTLFSVVAGFLL